MDTKTLLIAILVVAVAGLGYFIWQDQQEDSVSITIGTGGVSIEKD